MNSSYLDDFYQIENGYVAIRPEQASRFAKEVAGDFNPLHDADSKRFCVPGDLLFALMLVKQGLSQKMTFNFTGMVGEGALLNMPAEAQAHFVLTDAANKPCLDAQREGEITAHLPTIEAFTRAYVAFSGHSFPHILVPLMKTHQVMINPARPMVIYESMSFQLEQLNFDAPELILVNSQLDVDGKRGKVTLDFEVQSGASSVGQGRKTMVLSGLRDYDEALVQDLIAQYEASKA